MSATPHGPVDRLGRPMRDLRISVTDRCNFRCPYCMPAEIFGKDYAFLPRNQVLNFEEITRFARLSAGFGVSKIRLTGGEPLLRRDLHRLVEMVAAIEGVEVALTTNGALLAAQAADLHSAGLTRVTVSLDSLDPEVFGAMNGVGVPLDQVLGGIRAAVDAGFHPIKLNVVVKRGVNDAGLMNVVRYARAEGHILRFIEYMDVGTTNGWRLDDVVSAAEIRALINAEFPIEPLPARYPGEVAQRYRYVDGAGEIGLVASVTEPFCQGCTRARLSSDGKLFTCLFASSGHDVRALLRGAGGDDAVAGLLQKVWRERADRYSEERFALTAPREHIEMSYVGG
jgi:cyclic pyranopterin phosphate synthase